MLKERLHKIVYFSSISDNSQLAGGLTILASLRRVIGNIQIGLLHLDVFSIIVCLFTSIAWCLFARFDDSLFVQTIFQPRAVFMFTAGLFSFLSA